MSLILDVKTIANLNGRRSVQYNIADYSFSTRPVREDEVATLIVNYVNMGVNYLGQIISVWGYCPHTSWHTAHLDLPSRYFGELFMRRREDLVFGVSIEVAREWPVFFDPHSNWLVLGQAEAPVHVEFLPNAFVGLSADGALRALWIRAIL